MTLDITPRQRDLLKEWFRRRQKETPPEVFKDRARRGRCFVCGDVSMREGGKPTGVCWLCLDEAATEIVKMDTGGTNK